jgi:iron complex transport system permease protein
MKLYVILLILLVIVCISGVAIGSTQIPLPWVLQIILAKCLPTDWINIEHIAQSHQVIIWLIRVPRVLIAALVGAALAVAGVEMQGLFQNPLASPGIMGTSSGAALGAVIALSTGLSTYAWFYLPIFAFSGAGLALLIVYILANEQGSTPVATLLLAGVALNALLSALISLVISLSWSEYEMAREMVFWLMGGLDSRTWSHLHITVPGILLGGMIAMLYWRELDILLMGTETACSLGVKVERVKKMLLTSTALLTGTAVAVSGIIGFVGLMIPHLVRLIIGPRHRDLIPTSALVGAIFLVSVDLLARTLHRPEEIRLGILTALFGAPFFLYLLRQQRRKLIDL